MFIEERQQLILELLKKDPGIDVKTLAKRLYVSEPTVRRDLTELHRKGMITKVYGGALLNQGAADREIPFYIREKEKSIAKAEMGKKAASLIQNGMVLMLDGTTSAYHILPYLKQFKDLIVVTSGAKTAVTLAEMNIRCFCTGGEMLIHSYSYVGELAESFVRHINADLLFFSCHGLSEDGKMTDRAVEEVNLRRAMFSSAKQKFLLCDSSKFGKTYFYNLGHITEVDGVISDASLPATLCEYKIKEL